MIGLIAAARASDLAGHALEAEFGRTLIKGGYEWRALHGWMNPEELAAFTLASESIPSLITALNISRPPAEHFETFIAANGLAVPAEEGL
jgi:hypothetical protein